MKKTQLFLLAILSLAASSCVKHDQTSSSADQKDSTATMHDIVRADTNPDVAAPFDSAHVSLDNLPTNVKPWVTTHFPGYKIQSAAYDPLCGGGPAIDVVVRESGNPDYSLIFKPDGTFVQKEEDVPLATAPAAVRAQLKKTYQDFKPANQIERLTLADATTEYLFDLSKGSILKEVIMTEAGAIVCERQE